MRHYHCETMFDYFLGIFFILWIEFDRFVQQNFKTIVTQSICDVIDVVDAYCCLLPCSAKIAREEDEREQRLLEEEERRMRMRKEAMKRKRQ